MANLKDWILKRQKELNEEIQAIYLCSNDWGYLGDNWKQFYDKSQIDEALTRCDFEFDDGYGGGECLNFYVWFENFVMIKATYDGSEWDSIVPRNPSRALIPKPYGGG